MKANGHPGAAPSTLVNAETEERDWRRLGQPVRPLAAGVTGAVLLLLGSFAPVAHGPVAGTVSFTGLGRGQSPFLLFAAVVSVLHLRTWRRGNFGLALVVAAFLVWKALSLARLHGDVEPGWGWAPLVVGTSLLLLSSWPRKRTAEPHAPV